MKSLSGLDASFLYLETPETPMHVASFCLYELPRGSRGSFHRAVQRHLATRIHLAPVLSRRLASMPFGLGHPGWVEAGEVDLDFHVRKVPGTQFTVRQAQAAAARLHGQLMDRERPLWEFHVFDSIRVPRGMAVEGRLVGVYSKVHHAALDGKGGTVLANAVLDLSATPREVAPAKPSRGTPAAAGNRPVARLIGSVFSNSLGQYARLLRSLPAAAKGLGDLRPQATLRLAPTTVFNAGVTRNRVFATASLPFAEAKAMAKAVGGTFNDVVLWTCSTALRDYLARHATLPRKPLVAAMPVSLREASNQELNNQASITAVELGTHLADPVRRMQAIMASTGKVKGALARVKSLLPTDYPSLLSPWLVGGAGKALFRAYGKGGIAHWLPAIANVAISNVPGPTVPLYLAGARMVTFHPMSIVIHGLALNITVQTYAGSVEFGIVGDRKAVPHVQDLADALAAAFEEARGVFLPVPARGGKRPLESAL